MALGENLSFLIMAVRLGNLSKEQKIGFGLLVIFAFLSVGLGVLQIRNTMYGPLSLNNKPPVNLKDQVNTIDALRYRDTDHDELSDFDELYVYGTSPYLYDTFSYDLSDKEVIAKNLPLCPKGQDCATPSVVSEAVATIDASTTAANLKAQLGAPPPDLMATLQDPKALRQMLLEGGLDAGTLKKITDDQLTALAGQILASTSTIEQLRKLQNLTAAGAAINPATSSPRR